MRKTAVEWLIEQFDTNEFRYGDRTKIIEQAKQMEKEQIIAAHKTATLEAGFEHSADDWANQYYNHLNKNKSL